MPSRLESRVSNEVRPLVPVPELRLELEEEPGWGEFVEVGLVTLLLREEFISLEGRLFAELLFGEVAEGYVGMPLSLEFLSLSGGLPFRGVVELGEVELFELG